MSRAKLKSRKSGQTVEVCQEKLSCLTEKEPPVVRCRECKTLQCKNCDDELHKEGEFFFHVRVGLGLPESVSVKLPTESANATKTHAEAGLKSTVNRPDSNPSITAVKPTEAHISRRNKNRTSHLTEEASESAVQLRPDFQPNSNSGTPLQEGKVIDVSEVTRPTSVATSHIRYKPLALQQPSNCSVDELVLPALDEPEFSSGEFHSLGLDSILSTELNGEDQDMKGQSKSSKRAKSKKLSSTSSQGATDKDESQPFHGETPDIDVNHDHFGQQQQNGKPLITDRTSNIRNDISDSKFRPLENGDEELISDLMQSISGDVGRSGTDPDGAPHTPPVYYAPQVYTASRPRDGFTTSSQETRVKNNNGAQSFLLIDESEDIQIDEGIDFIDKLGCGNVNVKVVSIFGNTGDGKSYTLNQVFFGGHEVFTTSADQDTCTVGVWAAYDSSTKVICIDTEGLLGVTTNQNKRTRLLLKVLAVSDVIIYRTAADRLHTDLFHFLGDASLAYSKHFKVELEAMKPKNGYKWQDLGPSVIIFHETRRTNTLDMSASGKSANEMLRERFAKLECDLSSFSSLHYVGVKTSNPPTDFRSLASRVQEEINNCSVRSPRSPTIILDMLKILNTKFRGEIYSHSPNSFPDEFFTCISKCLACHSRCTHSMNHSSCHHHAGECRYVHVYDNKVYICKKCFQKGHKNVVVPKTCASDDNSFMGAAKYAWAGYILECRDCGVIYKSRTYWYGNQDPTAAEVQIEIRHIWPGQAAMPTGTHNAARKLLDGVKVVADVAYSYSSKPAKMLADWAADQVAPPYWVPNIDVVECHSCERAFDEHEKKHHCRGCGQGFCDECTQYTRPVPERGWGPSPVRVCEKCYNDAAAESQSESDSNSLLPRQLVENVQSVLGAVASVAIDYPIEVIKDSARPAYWIPDHLIKDCHQCHTEFGPKLTIHHCRACGNGVCHSCSENRRQVPSKGWDRYVRVCDACYKKKGSL